MEPVEINVAKTAAKAMKSIHLLLILVFTYLISVVSALRDIAGGNMENTDEGWNMVYNLLFCLQVALILLLSVSGIKTGLNFRRNK